MLLSLDLTAMFLELQLPNFVSEKNPAGAKIKIFFIENPELTKIMFSPLKPGVYQVITIYVFRPLSGFFPRPSFDLPGPFTFIFFPNSAVFVLFCFLFCFLTPFPVLPTFFRPFRPCIEHTMTEGIRFHLLPFNRCFVASKKGLVRKKRFFLFFSFCIVVLN